MMGIGGTSVSNDLFQSFQMACLEETENNGFSQVFQNQNHARKMIDAKGYFPLYYATVIDRPSEKLKSVSQNVIVILMTIQAGNQPVSWGVFGLPKNQWKLSAFSFSTTVDSCRC